MNKISAMIIKGVCIMSIAAAANAESVPMPDSTTIAATSQPIAQPASDGLNLETFQQRLSYAIGLNVGNYLTQFEGDSKIDPNVFTHAVLDRLQGHKLALDEEQYTTVMKEFQAKQKALASKDGEVASENIAEGKAFLAKNKKRSTVIETRSGLQYEVVTQGKGQKPKATDTVRVHYEGTLIDGTEFDSSYKRGEPTEFPLNGVISGWTEGLQLMPVGSKYKFYIPSKLAYGERGAGRLIGPNKTLIFTVELLEIKK